MSDPIFSTQEWLAATQPVLRRSAGGFTYQHHRPRLYCADGFNVSVQASDCHYCSPREDGLFGAYIEVELGYPSEASDLLANYAEDPLKPAGTIYGYVPVKVVDALLAEHGGIVNMPEPEGLSALRKFASDMLGKGKEA